MASRMPGARRDGFTLFEVLVALAIAGAVVLIAHQLTAGVADGARRAAAARRELDRWANARRVLTALAGSLEVGVTPGDGFSGEPERVTFTAWRGDALAIPRRHRVTLELSGARFVAGGIGGDAIVLVDSVRYLGVDYLTARGAGAAWLRGWTSPTSAPLAIRLRIAREVRVDTLLVTIGERG